MSVVLWNKKVSFWNQTKTTSALKQKPTHMLNTEQTNTKTSRHSTFCSFLLFLLLFLFFFLDRFCTSVAIAFSSIISQRFRLRVMWHARLCGLQAGFSWCRIVCDMQVFRWWDSSLRSITTRRRVHSWERSAIATDVRQWNNFFTAW